MNNNTDKEKWINDVLDSTQDMRRAVPPADLFDKVSIRLSQASAAKVVSIPVTRWAAAAAVLLALNLGSIFHFTAKSTTGMSADVTNPLATELQSQTTYNYQP